jgi:hypothetical protein
MGDLYHLPWPCVAVGGGIDIRKNKMEEAGMGLTGETTSVKDCAWKSCARSQSPSIKREAKLFNLAEDNPILQRRIVIPRGTFKNRTGHADGRRCVCLSARSH